MSNPAYYRHNDEMRREMAERAAMDARAERERRKAAAVDTSAIDNLTDEQLAALIPPSRVKGVLIAVARKAAAKEETTVQEGMPMT